VWLLISHSRSLEGYEAFGATRAEEETDDPESKGSRAVGGRQSMAFGGKA